MNIRPRDLLILAAIAVLAAGYGFDHFVLKRQHQEAATLQQKVTSEKATLAQVVERYDEGRAAEVALRRLGPSWRASHTAIPKDSDIPGLLRLLQRESIAERVGINAINVGGGNSSSTSDASVTSAPKGVTQVPLSFTFDGDYQDLNRLVRRLDALVAVTHGRVDAHGPFVGISQVSLAPDTGGLAFQLTVTLYQHGPASSVLGSGASTSS